MSKSYFDRLPIAQQRLNDYWRVIRKYGARSIFDAYKNHHKQR